MKKLFRTLVIFLALICCPFVFSACNEKETPNEDTPNVVVNPSDETPDETQNVTVGDVNTAFSNASENFTADLTVSLPEMLATMIGGMTETTIPSSVTGLKMKVANGKILLSADIEDTFEGEIYIINGGIYMREKENGEWEEFSAVDQAITNLIPFDKLSLDGINLTNLVAELNAKGLITTVSAEGSVLTVKVDFAQKVKAIQDLVKTLMDEDTKLADAIDGILEVVNYDYNKDTYAKAVDAFIVKVESQITAQTTVKQLINIVCDEFGIDGDQIIGLAKTAIAQMQSSFNFEVLSDFSEAIKYSQSNNGEEEEQGFSLDAILDAPVLNMLSGLAQTELSADPAADNYFGVVIDTMLDGKLTDLINAIKSISGEENNGSEQEVEESNEEMSMLDMYLPMIQSIVNLKLDKCELSVSITLNDGKLASINANFGVEIDLSNGAESTEADSTMAFAVAASVEFSNIGTTAIDTTAVDAYILANTPSTVEPTVVSIDLDVTQLSYDEDYQINITANEDLQALFEEDENLTIELEGIASSWDWDDDLEDYVEVEHEVTLVSLDKDKIVLNGYLVNEILGNKYWGHDIVEITLSDEVVILLNVTGELVQE